MDKSINRDSRTSDEGHCTLAWVHKATTPRTTVQPQEPHKHMANMKRNRKQEVSAPTPVLLFPPTMANAIACPSSSDAMNVYTVDPRMLFSGMPVVLGDTSRGGSLTFKMVIDRVTEVVWMPGSLVPLSTRFTCNW